MCFYGITWNDSWIYYFKGKQATGSKENLSHNEHACTTKFTIDSSFQWYGAILQMPY
jgi:hypothetical protein